MNKYKNGKIYKLVNDETTDLYVGSTTQTLSNRLSDHRARAKFCPNRKLYLHMNEIGAVHFKIILLEEYPCENIEQLVAKEDYYAQLLKPTLNTNRPVMDLEKDRANRKQWYEMNKDRIRGTKNEYLKEYRQSHSEEIIEQRKVNYEKNKEKIIEKNTEYRKLNKAKIYASQTKAYHCDVCNCEIQHNEQSRHRKTKKHLNNITTKEL